MYRKGVAQLKENAVYYAIMNRVGFVDIFPRGDPYGNIFLNPPDYNKASMIATSMFDTGKNIGICFLTIYDNNILLSIASDIWETKTGRYFGTVAYKPLSDFIEYIEGYIRVIRYMNSVYNPYDNLLYINVGVDIYRGFWDRYPFGSITLVIDPKDYVGNDYRLKTVYIGYNAYYNYDENITGGTTNSYVVLNPRNKSVYLVDYWEDCTKGGF